MTNSVWFEGVDSINRLAIDLGDLGDQAAALTRAVVRKTAADITRDAKIFAPVDTGNLKNSIGWTETHDGDTITADVGPTANYGAYVEFGTSTQAPAAYMGPAFDRHAPFMESALGQIVDRFR